MRLYYPESVNLRTIPESIRERSVYFLNLLSTKEIYDKRYTVRDFTPLKTEYLRRLLGRHYLNSVRDFLISNEFIECDNRFIVGSKSKGYRIHERFLNEPLKSFYLSGQYAKQIQAVWSEVFEQRLNEVHLNLKNCLEKIEIDYTGAIDFILNEYPKIYDENLQHKINFGIVSVEKIYSKDFFFIVDQTGQRVHTNISNLNKNLRQFLTINSKQLHEIDISNSQPFIFNSLISSFLSYGGQSIPKDLNLFKKLTSQGKFYEFLIEKFDFTGDRTEFKIDFFKKVFFGKNQTHYVFDECRKFRELFPNVWKVIEHYKRKDYRNLSIQLQRAESRLMIDNVCRELFRVKPDIEIVTIHDSIMTTKENLKLIKETIKSVFQNSIGIIPKVKIK